MPASAGAARMAGIDTMTPYRDPRAALGRPAAPTPTAIEDVVEDLDTQPDLALVLDKAAQAFASLVHSMPGPL